MVVQVLTILENSINELQADIKAHSDDTNRVNSDQLKIKELHDQVDKLKNNPDIDRLLQELKDAGLDPWKIAVIKNQLGHILLAQNEELQAQIREIFDHNRGVERQQCLDAALRSKIDSEQWNKNHS